MNIYVTEQTQITTVYKFTDSKNKILLLLFEQEGPVYTCLKPNLMSNP